MKRHLVLLAFLAVGSVDAKAQIGSIFGTPTPITARSAWEQLPAPLLACIERSLQQQGSSVDNLIRQNTYPNSPQYQNIKDTCERALRPKIEDASHVVKSPAWKTFSTEKRLAYFIEAFWVDTRLSYFKCGPEMRAKSFNEQKACLANNGFWFEAASPEKCVLTIMERVPAREEPTKSWDGKVVSVDIVARELTLRLAGLDERLIQRHSSIFDLYFELMEKTPGRRVAYSNDPQKWIDVPPPLLIRNFLQDERDKGSDSLQRAKTAWSMEVALTAPADFPGFTISGYFYQPDTNSDAGIQRLRDNQSRTFLKFVTPSFGVAFREEEPTMTATFVDTVKAVLSQCSQ